MRLDNIYQDSRLKHPLTDTEYTLLPDAWSLIKAFNKECLFITDYRRSVIKYVRKHYNPEQFYKIESVINKMFWNLRWLLAPIWLEDQSTVLTDDIYDKSLSKLYKQENLPNCLLICDVQKYDSELDLKSKLNSNSLLNSSYYRSFINKLIIIDSQSKTIFTKMMEGASHIFSKNYFNLMTVYILKNKQKYEYVMYNPLRVQQMKINLPEQYYQYDYAYPNLNFCTYRFGTDEERLDRVKKLYFTEDLADLSNAKFWFKLLKN